jgi:Protein of unknown function (DUF4197)
MKKLSFLFVCLLISSFAQAQLRGVLDKAKDAAVALKDGDLSQEEIGKGLKEALNQGVSEASDVLSLKDGFYKSPYKILMPEEAQKVAKKLKMVPGFDNVEADLTERMNRAAEDAAQKAKPIFIEAIKSMSFQDAMNILTGKQDAATQYLRKATYDALYKEFKPIIQASLDKVNAREYWKSATTAYNKVPMVTKTNTELDDHVTKSALIGMFSLVQKKEEAIRTNSSLRNTDILKKVFAKQDK